MEIRQLATFIRVAQFNSFSRAAESLGYSQSAVTVQIRQLEEELDTRLFDRMGKRIALTDTGERFFNHACEIMSQVNQARLSVTSTAELHGTLHIGTIESLACLKLPTVLHLYRKYNPKVTIRITVGEPEQLIEQMERGELDMIYVLDEPIAGVDPAARDYILNTILANYSEDASVLLSTHLIADIERVLDEVVFLKNGEMVLHESVDTIREEHGKSVDMLFREVFAC